MRILTHNLLICNVKNCRDKNISLNLIVDKSEIKEVPLNKDLIKNLIYKLEWTILRNTIFLLGEKEFPEVFNESLLDNDNFMNKLHNILFQFHILEGKMICSDCNRNYYIKDGIPNMLLNDNEI